MFKEAFCALCISVLIALSYGVNNFVQKELFILMIFTFIVRKP